MLCISVPLRKLVVVKTRHCLKFYKLILPAWARSYAKKPPNAVAANVKTVLAAASAAVPQSRPQTNTRTVPLNVEHITDKIQLKTTTLDPYPETITEHIVIPDAILSLLTNNEIKDNLLNILRTTGALPLLVFPKHQLVVELQEKGTGSSSNVARQETSGNNMSMQSSKKLITAVAKTGKTETGEERNIQGRVTLVDVIDPKRLQWHEQKLDIQKLPYYYMRLSKFRLTGLVVLTTLAGYIMAPAPMDLGSLFFVTLGTSLTSCAANAINQGHWNSHVNKNSASVGIMMQLFKTAIFLYCVAYTVQSVTKCGCCLDKKPYGSLGVFLEVPYDSQMDRTKNRVLVRGYLTPLHAFTFAVITASCGISILYFGLNGLTAGLGALNLFLYTCCYTPLKRCSILNTWVGSVVGAIPPMIGWAACTGALEPGAWIMAILLYSWQFPHFNALSWNLRPDYSRAGYRMMSVTDPSLCRRTALRHSCIIFACCLVSPLFDVTTWAFAIDSLPLNSYLVFRAWKFYHEADSKSSRKLFRLSLVHLPALILLMLISKKYTVKSEDIER